MLGATPILYIFLFTNKIGLKNFKPKINLNQNIHVMKYLSWIFHHMKAFGQAVYFFLLAYLSCT